MEGDLKATNERIDAIRDRILETTEVKDGVEFVFRKETWVEKTVFIQEIEKRRVQALADEVEYRKYQEEYFMKHASKADQALYRAFRMK